MDIPTAEGVVSKASAYSVADTVARLRSALANKGLTLFAVIDHSDAAVGVGLKMQEAKVLIFGSPQSGTPLMIASPLLALDLPLKALIWQDIEGAVWVSYTSPAWLTQRYHVPADLAANIAGIEPLIASVAQP